MGTVFLPHELDIADLGYTLLMPGTLNPDAIYNPLQTDISHERLCTTAVVQLFVLTSSLLRIAFSRDRCRR